MKKAFRRLPEGFNMPQERLLERRRRTALLRIMANLKGLFMFPHCHYSSRDVSLYILVMNEKNATGFKDESTMRPDGPLGYLSIVWEPKKPSLARAVQMNLLAQSVSAISKVTHAEKAFDANSQPGLEDFVDSALQDDPLADPTERILLDESSGSSTDSTLTDDASAYSTDSTLVNDSSEDSDSTEDSLLSDVSEDLVTANNTSPNQAGENCEQVWNEDDKEYHSQQQYEDDACEVDWKEDFIAECTEEEGFDDWPIATYEVPVESFTWKSALPNPTVLNAANTITTNGKVLEFLSLFLFDKRSGGISFKHRHGLANLMLNAISASCFDTINQAVPQELKLLQIRHHDQLELHWWLVWLKRLHFEGKVTFSDWLPNDYFIEKVRHKAIHRLNYDTSIIRTVVRFLIALNDTHCLIYLDKVLRILYGTLSGTFIVSDEESRFLDSALQLYPTECKTVYQVLYTVQGILENLAFEQRQPEEISKYNMTAAEELEIHFPEGDSWSEVLDWYDLTQELRNAVAHRDDLTCSGDMIGCNRVRKILEMSQELARSLGEEDAATKIAYVAEAALEELQTASMAQQQRLEKYSAYELGLMSKIAEEIRCRRKFLGDRCTNVSHFYQMMAENRKVHDMKHRNCLSVDKALIKP